MKIVIREIRVLMLTLFLLSCPMLSFGGDCTCFPRTLKEVLKANESSEKEKPVYIWGKLLSINPHVYTGPGKKAFDVKISQYWSDKALAFSSDTVVIFAQINPCGQDDLSVGLEYLLVLKLENDVLFNPHCSDSYVFEHYAKDIALLGKPQPLKQQLIAEAEAEKQQVPVKLTKKERKSQLIIWLVVSLLLNFFAIMLIVLLKREKQ